METPSVALGIQVDTLGQESFVVSLLKRHNSHTYPPNFLLEQPSSCSYGEGERVKETMSSGPVAVAPPAKNVVVHRNGDPFFQGRKFVVSQRRFLTFEAFLNEVTSTIQAPVAIRNIYTPQYGHRVTALDELQNGQQYVAAGFERFKKLNYLNSEMKPLSRKWKKDAAPTYPGASQRTPVVSASERRRRRPANLPCIIHVFRNGDLLSPPFRAVLSHHTLQDWNALLRCLSEKTQLRNGAVRKLCTLNGEVVSRGEDLVSGNYYVAVGLEKYQSLPYFELLVPPKMAHRPFRNLPNPKRRNQNQEFGQLYLSGREGSSDSALLETPQQGFQPNLRKVQSTGVLQAGNNSHGSLAAAPKQGSRRQLSEKRASIFHAKPVQVEAIMPNPLHNSYQDEDSVYPTKGPRKETAGAQEIVEDEETQVDLPIDQKPAEIVEEEVKPKMKVKPLRKVEDVDKLQKVHSVWPSAGDSGEEVTPKPHLPPAWRPTATAKNALA